MDIIIKVGIGFAAWYCVWLALAVFCWLLDMGVSGDGMVYEQGGSSAPIPPFKAMFVIPFWPVMLIWGAAGMIRNNFSKNTRMGI